MKKLLLFLSFAIFLTNASCSQKANRTEVQRNLAHKKTR